MQNLQKCWENCNSQFSVFTQNITRRLFIIADPDAGELKRGELAGDYVYQFKSQTKLMLLAYEFDPKTRHLLLLGLHENFYRELKR